MNKKPNFIVFFSDQQRPDSIGCYGQELPTTPNLDRMAAQGVRFERAYTPNPLCGPCRAALQTGAYPTATGNHVNNIKLELDADTIAKRLNEEGYATGYIGKWHLASSGPKNGPDSYRTRAVPAELRGGFKDYWLAADALEWTSHGYGGFMFDKHNQAVVFDNTIHRVDFMTDRLVDQLDVFAQDDRPFFFMASYLEPHHQNDTDTYDAPYDLAETFKDAKIPKDLESLGGSTQEHYVNYLGCVAAVDRALGRVLEKLDELNLADDTIVIFISDHGCHFKTRNGEYKRSCHDASIHVPLVVRGPGFSGGEVCQSIASLIDVPATLLSAAGVELPDSWHGRALQERDAFDWRSHHLSQLSEAQVGRCIRTERWTYSVRADESGLNGENNLPPSGSDSYIEDFLYDNEADPHQLKNLILDPTYEDIRKELRDSLLAEMAEIGEPPTQVIKPNATTSKDIDIHGAAS